MHNVDAVICIAAIYIYIYYNSVSLVNKVGVWSHTRYDLIYLFLLLLLFLFIVGILSVVGFSVVVIDQLWTELEHFSAAHLHGIEVNASLWETSQAEHGSNVELEVTSVMCRDTHTRSSQTYD